MLEIFYRFWGLIFTFVDLEHPNSRAFISALKQIIKLMKFTVDKQERYTYLKLEESTFNSLIAPDLKSEFVFYRNEGIKNLILDLSAVEYVDSSGLSSILTAERLWKGFGTFVITGVVSDNIKKLITISRLDTVLTIIPTRQEAIDYVLMDEIAREIDSDPEEG